MQINIETRHDPTPSSVAARAKVLGRELSPGQAEKLAVYLGLLAVWNAKMNLVGPHDWRAMLSELVADSWHLADFLDGLALPAEPRTLDLGSGAGLPGIPLRLFWPRGEYRLVEVREKRVVFMTTALSHLGLPGTSVFMGPAERLPESMRGVDLVVSRAFRPWAEVLSLAGKLIASCGLVIIMANSPPPPERAWPGGWRLSASREYPSSAGQRYFWAFTPESCSR